MTHLLALHAAAKKTSAVSEILHYLQVFFAEAAHHAAIVIGVFLILFLWRAAGAQLWVIIVSMIAGILLFPAIVPASVEKAVGRVHAGHEVGSTGLSTVLLVILIILAVGTVLLVAKSDHSTAVRELRKMRKQGGGEG